MSSFTPKDVMALREKTGMGMMDCKRALEASRGDAAAAEELLRKNARGKMAERTERVTAEGMVAVAAAGAKAAIVEIRVETDFAARNEKFRAMVKEVAKLALKHKAGPIKPDAAMSKHIEDVKLTTKENTNFARGETLEGGSFGFYVHHDGKRAALIQYTGTADPETLTGVCQHIVAHDPTPVGIDEADVPAEAVAKVRAVAVEEAKASGKPPEIATKMAEGKVRKFLQEKTLLNQLYVRDSSGKTTVRAALGEGVTLKRFVRYTVGAG